MYIAAFFRHDHKLALFSNQANVMKIVPPNSSMFSDVHLSIRDFAPPNRRTGIVFQINFLQTMRVCSNEVVIGGIESELIKDFAWDIVNSCADKGAGICVDYFEYIQTKNR